MKLTKPVEKRGGSFKGLLALAVASSLNLSAQDDDEEVFELSPFSIDASDNQGYAATSTLAGTRLNTNLKAVSYTHLRAHET